MFRPFQYPPPGVGRRVTGWHGRHATGQSMPMAKRPRIRPWRDGDEAGMAGLLDDRPDPVWAAQAHRLHGPDRAAPRWRRTLVAGTAA